MPLQKLSNKIISHGEFIANYCMFCHYKTIVEIGVQHGDTTIELCRAAKRTGGKVFGYDFFPVNGESIGAYRKDFPQEKVVERLRGFDNVKLTKIDTKSPDFKKTLVEDTNGEIDLAFIDACHSYDGAKKDFLNVYPLMSEAGAIVFHDTYSHIGLRKLVIDLHRENDGTYDVISLPFGSGNRRQGLTLLVKRSFPLHASGISVNSHDADMIADDIYAEEQMWYKGELR